TNLPVGLSFAVDPNVMLFALVVSFASAMLFGLSPALRASRPDLVGVLKDEAGALAGTRSRARFRSALAVTPGALSMTLLAGAGVLLRSLQVAGAAPRGFEARGVLQASLDLFPNGYGPEAGRAFLKRLMQEARTIPGAESATLVRRVPLSLGGTWS